MTISGEVIDWVERPPGLSGAPDAYALYVTGSSMEPRFFAGDLIFVHPHRRVRQGDVVVVQTSKFEGDPPFSWLKEFVRQTPECVVTRQYNLPSEIEFKAKTVSGVHRVLTLNELFGLP